MQIFIVIPLVFVIILVLIDSIKNVRIEKLRNQVYLSALEKNEKVPENWFPVKKVNPLETGIILIAVGLALVILLYLTDSLASSSIGLIPLFIGIGYVCIHFLRNRQHEK